MPAAAGGWPAPFPRPRRRWPVRSASAAALTFPQNLLTLPAAHLRRQHHARRRGAGVGPEDARGSSARTAPTKSNTARSPARTRQTLANAFTGRVARRSRRSPALPPIPGLPKLDFGSQPSNTAFVVVDRPLASRQRRRRRGRRDGARAGRPHREHVRRGRGRSAGRPGDPGRSSRWTSRACPRASSGSGRSPTPGTSSIPAEQAATTPSSSSAAARTARCSSSPPAATSRRTQPTLRRVGLRRHHQRQGPGQEGQGQVRAALAVARTSSPTGPASPRLCRRRAPARCSFPRWGTRCWSASSSATRGVRTSSAARSTTTTKFSSRWRRGERRAAWSPSAALATPAGNQLLFTDELPPGPPGAAAERRRPSRSAPATATSACVIDQVAGTVTITCKPAPPKSKTAGRHRHDRLLRRRQDRDQRRVPAASRSRATASSNSAASWGSRSRATRWCRSRAR